MLTKAEKTAIMQKYATKAVSYTHLDVYKRQSLECFLWGVHVLML